jgi:hypothetical protein
MLIEGGLFLSNLILNAFANVAKTMHTKVPAVLKFVTGGLSLYPPSSPKPADFPSPSFPL